MKIQNSNRRFRLISTTAIAAILLAGAPMVSADLGVDIGFQAAAKSCCFTAETLVRMADGSQRAIGDIREGDRVMGRSGTANTVTGIERVPLGERQLHGINDFTPFFTAEHPFLSPTGWRSVSPVLSRAETPGLKVGSLTAGDLLIAMVPGRPTIGATALDLAFDTCLITVSIITSMRIEEDLVVFNLLLDGDHTYIANDFVVHNKGGGEGGDSDSGGGEGGDSDSGGGEGGDSDNGGGEGGDSDSGGGERGDSDSSGGERGDDGESGESATTAKAVRVATTAKAVRVATTAKAVRVATTAKAVRVATTAKAVRVATTAKAVRVATTAKAVRVAKAVQVESVALTAHRNRPVQT